MNVAYHLRRLGNEVNLVSSVGCDALGDEALQRVVEAGLDKKFVTRHPDLPTGTVDVSLDSAGQATYRIHHPVAWDGISSKPVEGAPAPVAVVFGSLSLRSGNNRDTLRDWLGTGPRVRLCDLNLRPPFDDVGGLDEFVRGCTLLKVNEHEARALSPSSIAATGAAQYANYLASHYECPAVCVTLGDAGALLSHQGKIHQVPSPPVEVRDTIGAGDAFTAALLDGLLRSGENVDWTALLTRACALGAFVASREGAQPDYDPAQVPGLGMIVISG